MHILVTGSNGFVGSNLVCRLLDLGHKITAVDNLMVEPTHDLPSEAAFFKHNLVNDYRYFPELYRQLEYDPPKLIFALAALSRIQPSFEAPALTISNNVDATLNTLEIAKRYGSKIVYMGSSTAYADPSLSPYAYSKKVGEDLCCLYRKTYGVESNIVRGHNIYGPGQLEDGPWATVVGIFERCYREEKPLPVVAPGTQRRAFTHIDDLIEGLLMAAENDFGYTPISLGYQKAYSIFDVVTMFGSTYVLLPERKGETNVILAEYNETEQLTGWKAKIDLADYVNGVKKQ